MADIIEPSLEDIREYRNRHQCHLSAARCALRRRKLVEEVWGLLDLGTDEAATIVRMALLELLGEGR